MNNPLTTENVQIKMLSGKERANPKKQQESTQSRHCSVERQGSQQKKSISQDHTRGSKAQQAVHDAIIQLYLQVKIRSNDEIDTFEQDMLQKERDRLVQLDSLTVIDYIRTSIEILMNLKTEDEKDARDGGRSFRLDNGRDRDLNGGNASDFTSTFQSLDLPPKEYETQLQVYENDVRNHIKVEQQLKLHIEVLQEKIDDLEKDKDKFKLKLQEERRSIEIKVRDEYAKQVEQKQLELDKVTKELNKHKEFINAMERNRGKVLSSDSNHTASQVKVVRVNNFIGTTQKQRVANSHSPSGLAAGSSKDSAGSSRPLKMHKGIKVVQPGKSPYLNNHFDQVGVVLQSSQQANAENVSQNSSSKASRKGNASAEISESSLIVLKQSSTSTAGGGTTQTISNTSVQPLDNMKLMAAIQKMRLVNPQQVNSSTVQKSTTSATSAGKVKIVNLQNQIHKKNAKSLNPNANTLVNNINSTKSPVTSNQPYNNTNSANHGIQSESSSISTSSGPGNQKPVKQHSSSQNEPNNLVILKTDLNGSGNLNGSLKITSGQPKTSTKSSAARSKPQGTDVRESPAVSQIPSKKSAQINKKPQNSIISNNRLTEHEQIRSKGQRNTEVLSSGEVEHMDFIIEEAQMMNLSSGAMQAANQQDFIHQFQNQAHGYATVNQMQQDLNFHPGTSSSQNTGQITRQQTAQQMSQDKQQLSKARPRSQTGNQIHNKVPVQF